MTGPRFLAACTALAALLVSWGALDWARTRRRYARRTA